MKAAKLRKNTKKQESIENIEQYSLKSMIVIVAIIAGIFLLFYFITTFLVKPVIQNNLNNTSTEINSTKITLNNLLNRSDDEYYVLCTKQSLYNENLDYNVIYNNYINDYSKKDESLKFYTVDLDDAFNKNYLSNEINVSNDLNELKLNDEVLFKIKDKKIEFYYVGNSEIIKELSDLS